MNKQEVIDFILENPVFFLATTDGLKPYGRMLTVAHADHNGIVFCTGKAKPVNHQLINNNNVEMCFFSERENKEVRISGKVVKLLDEIMMEHVLVKFPFLQPMVKEKGRDILVLWRLEKGEFSEWSMNKPFQVTVNESF